MSLYRPTGITGIQELAPGEELKVFGGVVIYCERSEQKNFLQPP